jgi:hypothetical protein
MHDVGRPKTPYFPYFIDVLASIQRSKTMRFFGVQMRKFRLKTESSVFAVADSAEVLPTAFGMLKSIHLANIVTLNVVNDRTASLAQ